MLRHARYILLAFLAVVGIVSCGWYSTHTGDTQVHHDLGKLNSALFMYQMKQHAIPRSLEELVPNYISEIPEDPWGDAYCITNYLITTDSTNVMQIAAAISSGYTLIPNLRQITNAEFNATLNDQKLKGAAGSFGLEYPVYVNETEWSIYGSEGKYERISITLGDLKGRSCTFTADTNGIRITTASAGNIQVKRLPPLDALSLLLKDCIRDHTKYPGGPVKCSRADYTLVKKTAGRLHSIP